MTSESKLNALKNERETKVEIYKSNLEEIANIENSGERLTEADIDRIEALTTANKRLQSEIKEIDENIKMLEAIEEISEETEKPVIDFDREDLDEDEVKIDILEKNLSKERAECLKNLNERIENLVTEEKELKANDSLTKEEEIRLKCIQKNIPLFRDCANKICRVKDTDLERAIHFINDIIRLTDIIDDMRMQENINTDVLDKLITQKQQDINELNRLEYKNKINYKVAAVVAGIILTISLTSVLAASCSKQKKSRPSTTTGTTQSTNVDVPDNTDDDLTDAFTYLKLQLIDKGYTPYVANLLAQNGDEQLIFALLNLDYVVEPIESYTKAKNFDITRIADYEDARIRYNLSGEEAVDIANRATDLYNAGYFNNSNRDLTTLYNVLIAIRDKNIFFSENRETHQEIVNELFQICNKVMNNSLTETDLNKVAALPLFAKEGSDLRSNLEQATPLYVENFRNPGNTENNEKLYRHYLATTYGFGGTLADSSYSSGDQNFDNNAILEDPYDYFISALVFQTGLQSGVTAHMDWERDYDKVVRWTNLEEVQNELFSQSNYCEQNKQSR